MEIGSGQGPGKEIGQNLISREKAQGKSDEKEVTEIIQQNENRQRPDVSAAVDSRWCDVLIGE